MFSLGDSLGVEGVDETHPIIIPDITTTEFESLLRFFYFGYVRVPDQWCSRLITSSMHSTYRPTVVDWMELLSISTRFLFDTVSARAIQEITSRMDEASPFDLIVVALKHSVKQWLKPAYRKIMTRCDLITEAEAHKVPFSIVIMLTRSRERYHCRPQYQKGKNYNFPSVDEILDSEIMTMEQASEGGEASVTSKKGLQ